MWTTMTDTVEVDLDVVIECLFHSPASDYSSVDGNDTCPDYVNCFRKMEDNMSLPNISCPHNLVPMDKPEEMLKPEIINPLFTGILITHSVTFVVGVLGNGFFLLVMTWDRNARTLTKLFLMSLAVADLLLLLVCAPLETIHYFLVQWDEKGTVCKLASYAETLSAIASVLNLSAVSLERFLVIVFPMKSRAFCTISNCRKALFFVWIVSLLLSTPVLLTKNTYWITYFNNETRITVYYCNDSGQAGLAFAIYRFLILFVGPAILMILCYSWVIKALWMSTVAMQVLTQSNSGSRMCSTYSASTLDSLSLRSPSQQTMSTGGITEQMSECGRIRTEEEMKRRKQVIKMLILVIVLFMVCWGPRLIMDIFIKQELNQFSQAAYNIRVTSYLLPFIHSCINPIIYGFMSTRFQQQLIRHCQRLCCRQRNRRSKVLRRTHTGVSSGPSSSAFNSSLYSPMTEYTQKQSEAETIAII